MCASCAHFAPTSRANNPSKEIITSMYTQQNFKSKAALKRAVAAWLECEALTAAGVPCKAEPVRLFAPGLGKPVENGREYVEGPHYPKPHTWYAEVEVKNGIVVRVK
jgi:hypothetical protein